MNIRLIFIVERGILEQQTILSLKSIREFGNSMADCPVTCYSPRALFYPSESTVKTLQALGASVIQKDLNVDFKYYALANKPIILKEVAKNYPDEHIIFLDSDTLVFNDFHAIFSESFDAAAAPVFQQGIGIKNTDDENATYWNSLCEYSKLNIAQLPVVWTGVEKREIRAYYNTGVIAFNKNVLSQISSLWIELMDYAISNKIIPTSGMYFIEQSTFSLSIHSLGLNIQTLSHAYNFPILSESQPLLKAFDPNQTFVVHHQGNIELFLQFLKEEQLQNQKYQWLANEYSQYSERDKFLNKFWRWRRNILERCIYIIQDRLT